MTKNEKPDLFKASLKDLQQNRKEFLVRLGIITAAIVLIMLFPIGNNISGIARVSPENYVLIEATESGVVTDIFVKDGDKSKKGEPLLELYNNDILSELGSSYEQEIIVEQELLKLRGEKAWHKKLMDRNVKLHNKDVIATSEMELTRLKYNNIQLEIEIKTKELEMLKKRREFLNKSLEMTKVTSPIDGVVIGEIEDKIGTFMEKGDMLCQIVDTRKFLLEFPVDERKIRYANIGQPVTIRFYAYPQKIYKGVLKNIKPIFWEKSKRVIVKENVINVYIDFDPGELELKTGMSAYVRVHAGKTTLIKKIIDKVNYIVSM